MSLSRLIHLVNSSKYAEDLAGLRLADLFSASFNASMPLQVMPHESIEGAVMRVFRAFEDEWMSSGFFVRYLGIERWTAQRICGELADAGLLERRGRTSATRYRLPARDAC